VTDEEGRAESALLAKTSNLRDDLIIAAAKLEQYVDALNREVVRLKKLAANQEPEL
jgi:hypothetical protein